MMPESLADWISIIGALVMVVFGGGGVVAWVKVRNDAKNGVRQENRSDSDSLNAQAIAMVEIQVNYLIKPLQEKLDSLKVDVARLESEVTMHKTLYNAALRYIETLLAWFGHHHPEEVPPEPPVELDRDIR